MIRGCGEAVAPASIVGEIPGPLQAERLWRSGLPAAKQLRRRDLSVEGRERRRAGERGVAEVLAAKTLALVQQQSREGHNGPDTARGEQRTPRRGLHAAPVPAGFCRSFIFRPFLAQIPRL